MKIELNNMDTVVKPNSQNQVHVLAKRIPDAKEEAVPELEVVFDEDAALDNNGVLRVALNKLPVHEALIVSVFATN